MRALGAEVIRTPADAMMTGAVARARQSSPRRPGAYLADQFHNPVNPQHALRDDRSRDRRGSSAGRSTRGSPAWARRGRSSASRATSRSPVRACCAWPSSPRARSSAAARRATRSRGHRPLEDLADSRPLAHRRGPRDPRQGSLRHLPHARARGGTLRGRLVGRRGGRRAAHRRTPRTRTHRRHALSRRRRALSRTRASSRPRGRKDRRHGLFHRLHPRGKRARPGDRRGRRPDLPDLHVRPGGARQEQGLRIRAHAEPDALGAREEPRGARGRRRRPGLRLGHGGDHRDLDARQEGRPRRLLEHDLRRDLPLLHEDPGQLRRGLLVRRHARSPTTSSGRSAPRRRCSTSRPRPTRRCSSATSRGSRSSRTATAPSSSSTTRSPRRTSRSRSPSARTSSCTRRRSSSDGHSDTVGGAAIAKSKEHVEWLSLRPEQLGRDPLAHGFLARAARDQDARPSAWSATRPTAARSRSTSRSTRR